MSRNPNLSRDQFPPPFAEGGSVFGGQKWEPAEELPDMASALGDITYNSTQASQASWQRMGFFTRDRPQPDDVRDASEFVATLRRGSSSPEVRGQASAAGVPGGSLDPIGHHFPDRATMMRDWKRKPT